MENKTKWLINSGKLYDLFRGYLVFRFCLNPFQEELTRNNVESYLIQCDKSMVLLERIKLCLYVWAFSEYCFSEFFMYKSFKCPLWNNWESPGIWFWLHSLICLFIHSFTHSHHSFFLWVSVENDYVLGTVLGTSDTILIKSSLCPSKFREEKTCYQMVTTL